MEKTKQDASKKGSKNDVIMNKRKSTGGTFVKYSCPSENTTTSGWYTAKRHKHDDEWLE